MQSFEKNLIEMGLLSTNNIRGHMFWLNIIKGNRPIFFYVSKIKGILGAQKKRLIEPGLLSSHNIRGHMFWLNIIKSNRPIFFYVSKIKDLQWYHLL